MDSIRNRACRTLANLALDKHCCSAIHEEEEALQTIVNCLRETTDEDCQQTYARALRCAIKAFQYVLLLKTENYFMSMRDWLSHVCL